MADSVSTLGPATPDQPVSAQGRLSAQAQPPAAQGQPAVFAAGIHRPAPSELAADLQSKMLTFMREAVLPAEPTYHQQRLADGGHGVPPVIEELKIEARARGLWNLFLPSVSGLTQLEYAGIAELSGWSLELAPEAINGQAPDTGNMELLHLIGTDEQRQRWLQPLLAGTIRSAFAMTEPDVASSDATNIDTSIERDGDEWVINGRKWWASGAADPRCAVYIVMGKTDRTAATHLQQSMVLVPADAAGVKNLRSLPVFGRQDQHGHCEVVFDNVRVPVSNLLGEVGGGFAAAQKRLGPGRIHHCMRALGAAERALALMVDRAKTRVAFGKPLVELGSVAEQIAESRLEIEQARSICLDAAATIDAFGNKAARHLVAMAKISVPRTTARIIDRAIQIHGGAGISDDTPLAAMYGWHRAMRIFDGPDEVHLKSLAAAEIRREPVLPPR